MSRTDVKTIEKIMFNGNNYREIDRKSYSQLALYDRDRIKYYKKHVLKEQDEEDTEFTTMGRIVDTLMTEPDNFDNYFIIAKAEVPSPQMVQFCKFLIKNYDEFDKFSDNLTKSYEDLKEWNGGKLGTGFEKYVENFNKDGKLYFQELLEGRGKKVISLEEATIGQEIVKKIQNCKAFAPKGNKRLHKVVILFNVGDEEFKAELDEIEIDDEKKVIYPYDYKITSFVEDFIREGFIKKRYYIQQSLYKYGLEFWKEQNGYKEYSVEDFAFKVADQKNQIEPLLYKCNHLHYEQGWNGFYVNNTYYKGIFQILEDLKESERLDRWGISIQNFKNNNTVYIPTFESEKG